MRFQSTFTGEGAGFNVTFCADGEDEREKAAAADATNGSADDC